MRATSAWVHVRGRLQQLARQRETLACHATQEPGAKAPVIVAGKDQGEVDNDYLLIPVNILDHEGALGASFPVENRLLPQGAPVLQKQQTCKLREARQLVAAGCMQGQ